MSAEVPSPHSGSGHALAASVDWDGASELAEILRPVVSQLVAGMLEQIGREIPDYNRPLQSGFGEQIARAITASAERFLGILSGQSDLHDESELYVELGRGEMRSGRPIEILLAAYRVGARMMWRGFSAAGVAANVAPNELYRLAEALFAYVDELSAESAEGYAEEQALRSEARERERDALLELLLRRPAADPVAINAQAARAAWPLPESFAPVVLPAVVRSALQLGRRLPSGSIAATYDGMTVALVPDIEAPGRGREIRHALARASAVRGASGDWRAAAEAIERAILGARLQAAGVLPNDRLIEADDHLVELILHRDRERATALAARVLKPLDALSGRTGERLIETLTAWLGHGGQTSQAAEALHVHPQTMRYRVRQLEQILGAERLADPDRRLELMLALRIRSEGGRAENIGNSL